MWCGARDIEELLQEHCHVRRLTVPSVWSLPVLSFSLSFSSWRYSNELHKPPPKKQEDIKLDHESHEAQSNSPVYWRKEEINRVKCLFTYWPATHFPPSVMFFFTILEVLSLLIFSYFLSYSHWYLCLGLSRNINMWFLLTIKTLLIKYQKEYTESYSSFQLAPHLLPFLHVIGWLFLFWKSKIKVVDTLKKRVKWSKWTLNYWLTPLSYKHTTLFLLLITN